MSEPGDLDDLLGSYDEDEIARNVAARERAFVERFGFELKASGESFAALHVYRSGRAFLEQDVRFIEAVAGFLAHGLEIHRNRRTLEAENSRLRIHTRRRAGR